MKYLKFSNGDTLPAIGLGTWKSDKGEVYKVVRQAIEIGYRHFDCAYLYGNEKEIGQAFADALKAGDVARKDLFVTSKLWNNRHKLAQVRPAFEISLADLQLDYLDLYLIHWPVVIADHKTYAETGADLVSLKEVPLAETWQGMIDLLPSGQVKHIGVSNFNIAKIQNVWDATGVKPELNQVEMHPFLQHKALKAYADKNEILLTGYSPLGSQDRPQNRKTNGEPHLFENETVRQIAQETGFSTAQILLAWAVNYGTSAIPKSMNENRLRENLLAADIELACDDQKRLSAVDLQNRFIKGDFWCLEGSDYTLENLWDH